MIEEMTIRGAYRFVAIGAISLVLLSLLKTLSHVNWHGK